MNKRPICWVCLLWMLVIWICRLTGVPIFGAPAVSERVSEALTFGRYTSVQGRVAGRQQKENSIQYILSDSTAVLCGEQIHLKKVKVTVFTDAEIFVHASVTERMGLSVISRSDIPIGSLIEAEGKLSYIEQASNPGQFDSRAYYACRKIYVQMTTSSIEVKQYGGGLREWLQCRREKIRMNLEQTMHREPAGVLSAMLLGDKSLLSEESTRNFRYSGVSHVLAISGLHITMLGVAVYELLLKLLIRIFGIYRGRRCIAAAAGTAAVLMGTYCLFTGLPVSACRACVMFFVFLLGKILRKSYDLLCALAFAALLLLLAAPGYLFDAGFLLSFAAVLGVAVLYPALLRMLPKDFWKKRKHRSRRLEGILEAILAWMSINLVLMPLSCRYFYELPVYGLAANLLLVPCMGLLMGIGLIGSLLCFLSLRIGGLVLLLADWFLLATEKLTGYVRMLPGAVWITGQPADWQLWGYYGLLLAAVLLLRKENTGHDLPVERKEKKRMKEKRRKWCRYLLPPAVVFLGLTILFDRPLPADSLTMLDVGQGDALVLRSEAGHTYLLDGGSSNVTDVGQYRILPYLKQQGIREIEGIFLTHEDADHTNGILELMDAAANKDTVIRIRRVLLPESMRGDPVQKQMAKYCRMLDIPLQYVSAGDRITDGQMGMQVLHPLRSGGAREGNAGSLVLEIRCRGYRALLTGDLEGEGETDIQQELQDVDLLKVAHHGSRYSTPQEMLQILRPELALISAPKQSTYGHPHRELLERLEQAGADVWITRDKGAVTVRFEEGRMTAEAFFRE
ncbi:MAG: DNA internalization-related competence protein ComEC/Rec2 [Eubacteriales bacterium]|nr:DNA internalization-related competence protein ComEC/Rec2 [Eubacteriales bacterium]